MSFVVRRKNEKTNRTKITLSVL